MDLLACRLSQPDDQNAAVRIRPAQREPFVRGDHKPRLPLGFVPKSIIRQTLAVRSPDVPHIVALASQLCHRHAGDVFVDQDLHGSLDALVERGYLFLCEGGRVVQACADALQCQRWEVLDQFFDAVTVRQHSDDLVDGDARPTHARLPMAHARIHGDSTTGGYRSHD